MGRATSLLSLSSRSSSHGSDQRINDSLLPCLDKPSEKRAIRLRSLLGHSLYRRVVKWTLASLALLGLWLLFFADVSGRDVVQLGKARLSSHSLASQPLSPSRQNGEDGTVVVVQDGSGNGVVGQAQSGAQDQATLDDTIKRMPWLAFKHLDGYFHGLRTLVNASDLVSEYPNVTHEAPLPAPPLNPTVPKPLPYNPYHADDDIRTCYLDRENKVPAPSMYAYPGVPQHMPSPVMGSYELLGIRDDVCFDRFGRYGPYGLGYSKLHGGAGVGAETESSGSEEIWAETGQINYNRVDWGAAQERCHAANRHRFVEPDKTTQELPTSAEARAGKKSRMAVVVRCYQGFQWTELAVLNFRAMVTELSLKSGGEYTVHLLLHLHNTDEPIWADDMTVQRLLDTMVPAEFHGLVTLWSEPQMRLFYPGRFGETLENESGADVHGVYRSAHMPLQVFAMQHPEYEQIWNWEMDMRCLGNYYELFDRIGRWADAQPRTLLWERSARYYIPGFHGDWDNFTAGVEHDVELSGRETVFGPVKFRGRKPLRREERGESSLPDGCASTPTAKRKCGVGEAADIITLNPIFDTHQSGWIFSNDVTGYDRPSASHPPRRCSIVTASRLSRRLLTAMHEETWRHHHSMFSEMFPPTVALHHGLKAVYAPHPTFFDRAWQPLGSAADAAFNSGEHHSASGSNSPYDLANEHNHKGTSWYYHSEFAGLLWRRWLGYPQMDGRGNRGGSGTRRGGVLEESSPESSGRMCMKSVLLHPIKHEHPLDESD
ncbi:hypothetical protein XA68_17996 [Ophiocordyceps unilateralis]|uniref:Major facilitator superfamily transporter n=1 Tax=Ophiocordyceps unilateralis TaxID=268505 RepID=A0A2A9P2B7_OPHUN|nr:hypothetical protein XA68_17996 [Ophiocordyceps unilateralis]